MIIVKISGNLGQQLNQYAFGQTLAKSLGRSLKLDLSNFRGPAAAHLALEHFEIKASVADARDIEIALRDCYFSESSLSYDPRVKALIRAHPNIYLDGAWRDYRYHEDLLIELRAPLTDAAHATLKKIETTSDAVALYRYRSVTATAPNHVVLPKQYFDDAVAQLLSRRPQAHLFVFSDDPDWASQQLALHCAHTIVSTCNPIEQVVLMAACPHHICSNSDLSIIAAEMSNRESSDITVAQQAYAPHDLALLERHSDISQRIWPHHWHTLPLHYQDSNHRSVAQFKGGRNIGRPLRVAVWNYYRELTTDGFLFKNTEATIGANLLKPWCDLHDYGRLHGFEFVTYDQVSSTTELDAVVFMDRPHPNDPQAAELLAANIRKYLVLYECEVIKPDNWNLDYHAQFDRIFTWSDIHADGKRYIKNNFAIAPDTPFDFEVLKSAFNQRKLVTIIAGCKSSQHPSELYSQRLRSIHWYESRAPKDFDLYGLGWAPEDFPSYRGKVLDKLAILSQYRFMLCYENAKNIPGYITEKILDCFRAGVIPVYFGAPNIGDWIPRNCYIDLTQFGTFPELHAHLANMDQATHSAYLDRIKHFLCSFESYAFSSECFVTTMTEILAWDCQRARGEVPQRLKDLCINDRTQYLVQDPRTMALRLITSASYAAIPESSQTPALHPAHLTIKQSFTRGNSKLIICFGYGDEMMVFSRARALWQFFASHYPNIQFLFMRESEKLCRGEVEHNGHDLLIGIGGNTRPEELEDNGYAHTGVWSGNENKRAIFRQMALYNYLLQNREGNFYLYQATITSVIDVRGLLNVLDTLPVEHCYAGMPGRLNSPPELAGLNFICGTNSLFSRDMLELMLQRYEPDHAWTELPNDIWQALVLREFKQTYLMYFSFIKPRMQGGDYPDVRQLTRQLLIDGHYHFRVKTTSADAGLGAREDVDPWVMLQIMREILDNDTHPQGNRKLLDQVALAGDDYFSGPRSYPLTDAEAHIAYPDLFCN